MCRSSLRKGTVIYSVWKVLGAHDLRWIFCSLYGSMISVSTRDFHRHSRPNGQSSAAAPKDVCLWHVSAVLRTGLGQSGKRRWASSVLQRRPVSCHGWEVQTDARARLRCSPSLASRFLSVPFHVLPDAPTVGATLIHDGMFSSWLLLVSRWIQAELLAAALTGRRPHMLKENVVGYVTVQK
jgi:hypothetical protein